MFETNFVLCSWWV